MSEPTVSVMVPAYHAELFLAECLDSILAQEVEGLQIVVSDDASGDATPAILRAYEGRYPSVIKAFYNRQNLGITRNCNQILAACTGKYISLFAGDDVMLPGKLKTQIAYMEENPDVVMTYHAAEIFDSATGQTIAVTNTHPRLDTSSVADIISKVGIAAPMSIVLRRSALPEGGYNESLRFVSDWLLQIEVAAKGRVAKLPGVWCRYRKHGENNGKDLSAYLHEFELVIKLAREKFADDPAVLRACDQGLARFRAGEGFRRLERAPTEARELFGSALMLDFKLKYLLAWCAACVPGIGPVMVKNKERLKRLLG